MTPGVCIGKTMFFMFDIFLTRCPVWCFCRSSACSLDDIAEFLNGLRPLDIVVPTNNTNGSIGVLFSTLADVDAVMKRDKDSIGSRYIDVIRIPRSEYYNMALDSVSRESDGDANMMGADGECRRLIGSYVVVELL